MFNVHVTVMTLDSDGKYNTYNSNAPKWCAESAEIAINEVMESLKAHVRMGRDIVYTEGEAKKV